MMIYAVNMKKEGEKMNNFFGFMGFKNYKRLLKTTTKKDYGIYLELKKQKKGKLKWQEKNTKNWQWERMM